MYTLDDMGSLIPACEFFTESWNGKRRIRPADLDGLVDGGCMPLPAENETVLDYWVATKALLQAGKSGIPPLVLEGEIGIMVTDKKIRGSVIAGISSEHGNLWASLNAFRNKRGRTVVFAWDYNDIDVISTVRDIGVKQVSISTNIAHLFATEIAIAKPNWIVKGIGARNRTDDFANQVAEAVSKYRGLTSSWREESGMIARERQIIFID